MGGSEVAEENCSSEDHEDFSEYSGLRFWDLNEFPGNQRHSDHSRLECEGETTYGSGRTLRKSGG